MGAALPVPASAATAPLAAFPALRAADFDVRAFGATGDGKTLDTAAINKAIDEYIDAQAGQLLQRAR